MKRGSSPVKVRQWRERLLRFRESRQTVAEFCREERVSSASLYRWRKALANRVVTSRPRTPAAGPRPRPSKSRRNTAACGKSGSPFKPVQVKPGPPTAACLTVRLPGGVQLTVNDQLTVAEMVLVRLLEHTVTKKENGAC